MIVYCEYGSLKQTLFATAIFRLDSTLPLTRTHTQYVETHGATQEAGFNIETHQPIDNGYLYEHTHL